MGTRSVSLFIHEPDPLRDPIRLELAELEQFNRFIDSTSSGRSKFESKGDSERWKIYKAFVSQLEEFYPEELAGIIASRKLIGDMFSAYFKECRN